MFRYLVLIILTFTILSCVRSQPITVDFSKDRTLLAQHTNLAIIEINDLRALSQDYLPVAHDMLSTDNGTIQFTPSPTELLKQKLQDRLNNIMRRRGLIGHAQNFAADLLRFSISHITSLTSTNLHVDISLELHTKTSTIPLAGRVTRFTLWPSEDDIKFAFNEALTQIDNQLSHSSHLLQR